MAMSCIALTSCLDDDDQQTSVACDPKTQYLCGNGKKCIVKDYLCNGVVDCDDRDDETDCGKLVHRMLVHFSNHFSVDMRECSDTEKYFKCRTGDKCISKSLTCDEVADCSDGSDESESVCGDPLTRESAAPRKKCDADREFECEANICISQKLVCDSVNHCSDGRDEAPELCASKNVS